MPIFVKNIFHGFIGFDDCRHERIWSEDELNTFQSLATNISNSIERIQNELIIEESENNFRQINETIEDTFWLYDVINRKYIYMSPSCEKVLEIAQSHFYAHTHTPFIRIVEEDKNKFFTAETALHTQDSYDIEYRIILNDGNIKWINEKSFAIRDANGKLIRNSGICIDITEKKNIQTELKQLSLVAEKTTNGVLIADAEGYSLWANQAYLDMFEIPLTELLNKRPRDLFQGNDEMSLEIYEANGTNFTKDLNVFTFKGNQKWVELTNTIVTDENGKVLQQVEILTDTTERKTAEEKLKKERQLLRAIIDNVPINIYVKDLAGRKILANKCEYEFVGAKSEAEVIGKHDFDLYDSDIANQTVEKDENVLLKNKPILDFESLIRRKDGTERWILSSKIPLQNELNDAIGLVGIGMDITERKQIEAERQIDLEVEKMVNIFAQHIFGQENIDNLLWEVTQTCIASLKFEDAVIYWLDESGANLYQRAAYGSQIVNGRKKLSPIIIPLGQGIVGTVAQTGIAEIIADTTQDSRYIVDDSFRNSEMTIPIKLNGKIIGVFDSEHSEKDFYQPKHLRILNTIANLLANRIDRILAEEKVKESEERFRFIAENTSDGIFVSEDNIVTYTSPSCEKILGYSFEEFHKLSREIDLLELVHPNDKQGFLDTIDEVVSKQQKSFNHEYRTKSKSGTYIWREDNINILYDEDNKPHKFIIVIRDTTEKVEKKQQLQHLVDVTSKQNERLMNFAHIVSHNIRSHSSNLSMIVDFMGNAQNEASELNYFAMLKQSTEKLAETIENLNEIITIQNNINKPKVDLYLFDEIQKTLKALNIILLANDVTIINEVSHLYKVKGIASYMESIFLNLLTNAIKYRSPDRSPIISFSAEIQNNYIVLSIKDNGIGIDLKMHGHKIFGMYKTFHRNADARGIGLFITKNQIEAMNGKIEVESKVGEGTTFKVYFYMEN
jgi:PAS domain S-box-containing protein